MDQRLNESLYQSVCNATKHIVQAAHLTPFLYAQVILGLLAIPPNFVSLIVVWRVKIFHGNLRLLLSHFSFHLLWNSAGLMVKDIRTLDHLYTNPCDLITSAEDCRWQALFVSGKPSVTIAMLIILIERCYAAVRAVGYQGEKPWLGIVLVAATWAYLIYIQVAGAATVNKLLPICDGLMTLNPRTALITAYSSLSTEVVALALVIFVHVYNRHILQVMVINQAKYNLNRRFQIDQNIQITRILAPSMILHVVCYLPNFILLFLILCQLDLTDAMKMWFIQIFYLLKLVHAIVHPVLAFYRNPHMRKQLLKCIPKFILNFLTRKTIPGPGSQSAGETKVHFQMLQSMWAVSGQQSSTHMSSDKSTEKF